MQLYKTAVMQTEQVNSNDYKALIPAASKCTNIAEYMRIRATTKFCSWCKLHKFFTDNINTHAIDYFNKVHE